MAGVNDVVATELTILGALPDGFLDCSARNLHNIVAGPTLIELAGAREPPLFVSVLLHGNEGSGLTAVQRVIAKYRHLPRSLMLFVGNVAAAREGLRRLDHQPDYNRIWPGGLQGEGAEALVMAEVHDRVVERRAFAAIDLHNNSGRNPHYTVICKLDPRTLALAAVFSPRVVLFRGIPGTQTASFTGLVPAITAECGRPAERGNAAAAARLVDAALNCDELSGDTAALQLYHTLGVVRVREDVTFGFGSTDAELRFTAALDAHNFCDLASGTVLAETNHPKPLKMIDAAGRDVAEEFFATVDGKLRLLRKIVPAMFTVDPLMIRQDCLGYLMERI
jgi:succinylglutamate desuccinylase